MSEPGPIPSGSDPGQLLVSEQERQAAVSALQAHRAAGRLSSAEYEDRSVLAGSARRWEELTRLFSDLPEPHPVAGGVVAQPAGALPAAQQPVPGPADKPVIPLPPNVARTVMALTPFVALVLFFTTSVGWLWFLMIPVVAILVGGSLGGKRHRDR